MKIKQITDNLVYFATIVIVLWAFMAANRIDLEYSPYQVLMWEIKANEGFRTNWYKDGFVKGKQSYSIGFGWNDQGGRRRKEIKPYLTGNRITFDNATKLTLKEIEKYGQLHKDPWRNKALQLYSYNCGLTKNGKSLGRCCKASKGCGNKNRNIRASHNRRRKFELALWNHDFAYIQSECENNKQKIKKILINL